MSRRRTEPGIVVSLSRADWQQVLQGLGSAAKQRIRNALDGRHDGRSGGVAGGGVWIESTADGWQFVLSALESNRSRAGLPIIAELSKHEMRQARKREKENAPRKLCRCLRDGGSCKRVADVNVACRQALIQQMEGKEVSNA